QRPRPLRQDEGTHPAAAVRGRDSGRDRIENHRPHHGEGATQKRDRQVLWWRHLAKAQTARAPEGRQEAHEAGGQRRDPPGGIPGHLEGGVMALGNLKDLKAWKERQRLKRGEDEARSLATEARRILRSKQSRIPAAVNTDVEAAAAAVDASLAANDTDR